MVDCILIAGSPADKIRQNVLAQKAEARAEMEAEIAAEEEGQAVGDGLMASIDAFEKKQAKWKAERKKYTTRKESSSDDTDRDPSEQLALREKRREELAAIQKRSEREMAPIMEACDQRINKEKAERLNDEGMTKICEEHLRGRWVGAEAPNHLIPSGISKFLTQKFVSGILRRKNIPPPPPPPKKKRCFQNFFWIWKI